MARTLKVSIVVDVAVDDPEALVAAGAKLLVPGGGWSDEPSAVGILTKAQRAVDGIPGIRVLGSSVGVDYGLDEAERLAAAAEEAAAWEARYPDSTTDQAARW